MSFVDNNTREEELLSNKSLTQNILEHLREQIITSKLEPGQRLNENQIALDLAVSRPPLREALQVLEQENFVVCIPRKGRYVAEITWENYEKIHQARLMIECHVIDVLKEKNLKELPKVDLAIERGSKNTMARNNPIEKFRCIEALNEFHGKLVDSIENDILNRFYGIIKFNIYRYHYWLRVLHSPDSVDSNMLKSISEEHCKIRNLIGRSKFEESKDFLKWHMDRTRNLMRNTLQMTKVGSKATNGPFR